MVNVLNIEQSKYVNIEQRGSNFDPCETPQFKDVGDRSLLLDCIQNDQLERKLRKVKTR